MIKAVIIDDEEFGRSVLKNLILKYCPDILIVGEASSAREGKRLIEKVSPNLVFLDIQMPGGSGFDLLEQLDTANFSTIFTTAYDQYAVKAFKYSALDYLLKPINIEDLTQALKKIANTGSKKNIHSSLQNFIESYNNSGISKSNKIGIPTHEGLVFADIAELIRCEADGKNSFCFLIEGKKIHSTNSLKDFEEQLKTSGFCRVHHANLININHIKSYEKGEGGTVILSNGDVVSVSKRKKDEFLSALNKL